MNPIEDHSFLNSFQNLALPVIVISCAAIWGCTQSLEFLRFSVWLVLIGFTAGGCFFAGTAAEKNENSIFIGVLFLSLLAMLITLLIKGIPFIFEGQSLSLF